MRCWHGTARPKAEAHFIDGESPWTIIFEARIRTRAYELWEKDASPEGVADEYWERALRQLAAEGVIGQDAATTPKDQSAKHSLAELLRHIGFEDNSAAGFAKHEM